MIETPGEDRPNNTLSPQVVAQLVTDTFLGPMVVGFKALPWPLEEVILPVPLPTTVSPDAPLTSRVRVRRFIRSDMRRTATVTREWWVREVGPEETPRGADPATDLIPVMFAEYREVHS